MREQLGNIKRYLRYWYLNFGLDVHNFNDFFPKGVKNHWPYQYVHGQNLLQSTGLSKPRILFIGVYGKPLFTIKNINISPKVFYTAENIHEPDLWANQAPNCYIDNPKINLSLGFDFGDSEQYMRFPFWLRTFFPPNVTYEIVREKCERINKMHTEATNVPNKFCSFIARYDYFGDRTKLCDEIEKISSLSYPSMFRHNDDDLQLMYKDNKVSYLKQFKFNLCPENYDTYGYVTEKIFDAIEAGCIPIYWGSENKPELKILNHNAIIFLTPEGDNSTTLEQIRLLNSNTDEFLRFYRQPIFLPEAPDIIWGYYERLNKRLRELLNK